MVQLPAHVRVEQALITLAPAPKHIVLAAQHLRHVQALFHLGRGDDENVGLGRAGGAVHVPGREGEGKNKKKEAKSKSQSPTPKSKRAQRTVHSPARLTWGA